MFKILEKLIGSKQSKDIKELEPLVEEINEVYAGLTSLSDDELKAKTQGFRDLIQERTAEYRQEIESIEEKLKTEDLSHDEKSDLNERAVELKDEEFGEIQETLDEILPEAFAVVKETCRRLVGHEYEVAGHLQVWKEIPYDVQLMGGVVLHQGKIAEMQTGEGKTLVSVLPIYLNALPGRGVHLITVNDYLATRDKEWMQPVFDFHGFSVGCIKSNMAPQLRSREYNCDITYGTNNEFGFDYLRDNMAASTDTQVQRPHFYAVIDEVDSVLIDEARTPLIISGPVKQTEQQFDAMNPLVKKLVDAQRKQATSLVAKAEKLLEEAKDEKDEKRVEAGIALLRAFRSVPKHKRLMKILQDPNMQKLRRETELEYLKDQGRRMAEIDEELYFAIDERNHQIDITEKGRELLAGSQGDADMFLLPDLATEMSVIEGDEAMSADVKQTKKDELMRLYADRSDRIHTIQQLLRGYSLYEKDIEYVVQDGKIKIVDEHTGRILEGRRYSEGLHQAIEAKEGVRVQGDTQTYATVTLQNYFRMYRKLAGMTGTAETEAAEFMDIYELDVVVIPTNRPIQRKDMEDQIYRTTREKFNAVIEEVRTQVEAGRPVLVGTASVEVSEILSKMLKRSGIKHNVLNAKQHAREAEIVSEAGRKGAVTIATNMAGRGTDIKLSDSVKEAGGLCIIGTERHDARRIDRQLRGRSGRQGDPGSSRFFLSLEDKIMRLFGGDRVAGVMQRMNIPEGEPIEHKMITKSVERAQKKVEENNFAIRKRLLEYDDVMNSQREVIYDRRQHALRGERLKGDIFEYIHELTDTWFNEYHPSSDLEAFQEKVATHFMVSLKMDETEFANATVNSMTEKIVAGCTEFYNRKEEMLGSEFMSNLERVATLRTIDDQWKDHLRNMDELKEGIHLRAYAQKNPLMEYKGEAYQMFVELVQEINAKTVQFAFRYFPQIAANQQQGNGQAQPQQAQSQAAPQPQKQAPTAQQQTKAPERAPQQQAAKPLPTVSAMDTSRMQFSHPTVAGSPSAGQAPRQQQAPRGGQEKPQPVRRDEKKVGRNDPCPCGSGKKYKQCHGRNG